MRGAASGRGLWGEQPARRWARSRRVTDCRPSALQVSLLAKGAASVQKRASYDDLRL